MSEKKIMQEVQIAVSKLSARVFRNNIGYLQDKNGTWIKFGVCNPGGADLIGWLPIEITQAMVGRKAAIFVAIETKTLTGKPTQPQIDFLLAVNLAGGIGIIARSVEEAENALKNF